MKLNFNIFEHLNKHNYYINRLYINYIIVIFCLCLSRMLNEIPSRLDDLGDLESKLSAYYAKIEKDKGLPKR